MRSRARLSEPAFDGLLALALVVAAQLELLTHGGHPASLVVDGGLLFALTLPVAWRRRWPLGSALAVIAVVCVLDATAAGRLELQVPQFALFLPPYAVAAYAPRRRALIGLALLLLGVGVHNLVSSGPSNGATGWVFSLGMCSASWAIARAVRGRRELAAQLTRTAELISAEREHSERLAIADERTRIARELQAVVAHSISAMVVQSGAAQRLLDSDLPRAHDAIAVIEQTGRDALAEMRRIVGVLRSDEQEAELRPQPGVGQLHRLIADAREQGRQIELHVEGQPRPLPASVDLGVYRIVQDTFAGFARDGAARDTPISVVVRFGEAGISLDITAAWPVPADWPTVAIRERVALCSGSLELRAVDRVTEHLHVTMPGTLEGALA